MLPHAFVRLPRPRPPAVHPPPTQFPRGYVGLNESFGNCSASYGVFDTSGSFNPPYVNGAIGSGRATQPRARGDRCDGF